MPPVQPDVSQAAATLAEQSHPSDVIQYNITLWFSVSIGFVLIGALMHFVTSFGRDDPVLYSQLNINSSNKNK